MNTELFNKHYHEQLALLPSLNQSAIQSIDWMGLLIDIGKSHGIDHEDILDLQLETMLVLVGLEDPNNYENQLIAILALSPAEADKLITDITEQIFTPIANYIISNSQTSATGTESVSRPIATVGNNLSSLPRTILSTPVIAPVSSDVRGQIHAGFHDIEFVSDVPSEPEHETIIDKKLNDIFEDETETIHHL